MTANIELEFSAGLILRTLILDYLFALHTYGIHQSETKTGKSRDDVEREVELCCNKIFADSLRYTLKHVEEVQQEGWISEAELFQHYRQFAKRYPEFVGKYNEDGKAPSIAFDNPKQGKGIYQHLSKDPSLKHLAEYYDLYVCYSKYEHFGIFSYELLRQLPEDKLKRLRSGVELLVLHFFVCLEMLQEYFHDGFIKNKYKIVGTYIHVEIFPDLPI